MYFITLWKFQYIKKIAHNLNAEHICVPEIKWIREHFNSENFMQNTCASSINENVLKVISTNRINSNDWMELVYECECKHRPPTIRCRITIYWQCAYCILTVTNRFLELNCETDSQKKEPWKLLIWMRICHPKTLKSLYAALVNNRTP